MTVPITLLTAPQRGPDSRAGLGALRTERGNLPLDRIDVRVEIIAMTSQIEVRQDFVNTFDVALEASYIFPLPARAAVTGMRLTVDGQPVEAELHEREAARRAYDDVLAAGRSGAITEEERPDIFTMRVANLKPGERISVALTLVKPLDFQDGEATLRVPLVVAPRYIPGEPLAGLPVGDGYADDTDAVPDASRITPPVLLPGFPHPVALSIEVGIDPAGLELSEVRSSLPVATGVDGRLRVQPGERPDRDFILRLRYAAEDRAAALVLAPDADGEQGTYQLTVLPPKVVTSRRPLDLVLVLDRSAGMAGWKMPAARRASARIVDILHNVDRFAVLTFADRFDHPTGLPDGLVEATDRNRYRAIEHLARVDVGGGKELLPPLRHALDLVRGTGDQDARDAVVVLVTDGHVGNEDQVLRGLAGDLGAVRVHAVGIDQVVNGGFLSRLAEIGGGCTEFVESEDRLDEAMQAMQRRIEAPLVHALTVSAEGLAIIDDTASPARLPDLYPGVPLVVSGRYRGAATGSLTIRGVAGAGETWSATAAAERREATAVTARWARAHLRDLEDRYVSAFDSNGNGSRHDLAQRIVDTSLRFGVLCRFTAYLASRDGRVIAAGENPHRVLQPVEAPAGWDRHTDSGLPVAITPRSAREPRTVKLRNVIAVAVAGLLVLATGWVYSLGRDSAATRNGVVAGKPAPTTVAGLPAVRGGMAENTVAPAPLAPPEAPRDFSPARDVVTNGSLRLVVGEPTQAADRLVSAVSDAGGRVDSRSERSTSSSPTVDLVLRIPADKVDAILADAKKLGAVQAMSIRYTDVTGQRVDLDARIDALQTSVTRLLELMARATNTADLLSAESSLTQRQAELDSLRAQRTALHDEVSYATINVSLSAEPTVDHTGTGFIGALERGWRSLMSTAHGAVLMIGFLIPWLAVLAVPVLIGVVVLRRRTSRSTAQTGP